MNSLESATAPVEAARIDAEISLRELARRAALSPALTHKILGGYRSSAATRLRVARALDRDPIELWPGLPTRSNRHGRPLESVEREQRRRLAEIAYIDPQPVEPEPPATPKSQPELPAPERMIGTPEPFEPTPEEVFGR